MMTFRKEKTILSCTFFVSPLFIFFRRRRRRFACALIKLHLMRMSLDCPLFFYIFSWIILYCIRLKKFNHRNNTTATGPSHWTLSNRSIFYYLIKNYWVYKWHVCVYEWLQLKLCIRYCIRWLNTTEKNIHEYH